MYDCAVPFEIYQILLEYYPQVSAFCSVEVSVHDAKYSRSWLAAEKKVKRKVTVALATGVMLCMGKEQKKVWGMNDITTLFQHFVYGETSRSIKWKRDHCILKTEDEGQTICTKENDVLD